MSELHKELSRIEFEMRENSMTHTPVENEMRFYEAVKRGDMDAARTLSTPLGGEGFGVLSTDRLRNLKYHLVVTVSFITRFCVEGGMEMETAYTLSDLYILKADKCMTEKDIHALHKEAVLEFTRQMNRLATADVYSKPVIMTMDYIYDHLHSKINETEIAEYVSLSPSYISRLFKKEVGVSLSTYIAVKRVETAQNMLKYSDYPPADIGNYLAFTSHSHFISVFRKYTGMTPNEFRKKYYRDSWGNIKQNSAKK